MVSIPKLIALDIDGTVSKWGNPVSAQLRRVVTELRDAGSEVILATGRPLVATLPVAADLGIDSGWLVCSNGSVTANFSVDDFELRHCVTFDPRPAIRVLLAELPAAGIGVENVGVGYWVNKEFLANPLYGVEQTVLHEQFEIRSTPRIMVRDSLKDAEDALAEKLHELGLLATHYQIEKTLWMDLAPFGITKAYALERLREQFGFALSDTLAIGDSDNDIEMLEWAGTGIAMGHAANEVKAVADRVTGSIEEDGACQALSNLL